MKKKKKKKKKKREMMSGFDYLIHKHVPPHWTLSLTGIN